jgi:hypothetical protein
MNKLLLSLAFVSASVFAVDDGVFELDGNAVQDTQEDWQTLYLGGGTATLFSGIIKDKNGADNIFTGGGSKVPLDFPGYKWKSSPPPPDKTNITNAYAANYDYAGDQVIVFGADLFADNGDAEIAFWLLQDDVATLPDGTFSGVHVNGDVYIASKFSNGGRIANIAVFEWDDTCSKDDRTPTVIGSCAAQNIAIVIPEGPALCDGSGSVDACAITNLVTATAPWDYEYKGGGTDFAPTTFFEGGINISAVFGASKCFSSYMVATGASTSFTSTAKDFALGNFDVCSVDVSSFCYNPSEADDTPLAISYRVVGCAENDGAAAVDIIDFLAAEAGFTPVTPAGLSGYIPQVTFIPADDCDDFNEVLANATGVSGNVIGELVDPGEAIIYAFPVVTAINAVSYSVELYAAGEGGSAVDPAFATTQCPPRTFDAALSLNKQCQADLEASGLGLTVLINVYGQICNDGEVDLVNLQLADYVADGTVNLTPDSTTIPVGQCINYTGSYYPQSIPSGDVCPFMDMVTASVTIPAQNTAGASCVDNGDGTLTCTENSNSATCELRVTDGDNDCSTGSPSPLP